MNSFAHCRCIALYVVQNILAMKICLYAFFPHFQLTMDVFVLYWFCCQLFRQLRLKIIQNLFILRHPLICLKNIKWHCIGWVFVVLWHTITKYIFRHLDKHWYQYYIDLIAYNLTAVLSIIAWHFIRKHHFVLGICLCL